MNKRASYLIEICKIMKTSHLFVSCLVLLTLVHLGASFIIEGLALGAAALGYAYRCQFYECCDDNYIPRNTGALHNDMRQKLYGQQIAQDIVFSAIQSHVYHSSPRKPLVLSFHGLPGSGKNYVVSMIANALFKLGEKSKNYHFFNGRSDFPSDSETGLYRRILRDKIDSALNNCERSVFVFDEVDKMAPGILDVLVPFLDYTSWSKSKNKKAIFIFLSNTGSEQIVKRMLELWEQGKKREDVGIQDFEPLIQIGAFNEKGGLYRSGTIESKLIDHHVPFLPMEQKHVIDCIRDSFKHWGNHRPSMDLIHKALEHVTFGPPPHNLYSTSGCKRLDHKVSSILFRREFDD